MKFQIFTRNFIGKTTNFHLSNNVFAGGAEIYLVNLISTIKLRFPESKIELYQLGEFDKEFEYNSVKVTMFSLGNIKRRLFPFYISRKFYDYIDPNAIKIFNYPNYASNIGKIDKSIGIFHGVEWDVSLFKYVYYETRFKGIKYLIPSLFKYLYFRLIVPRMVERGIQNLDLTVAVDSNIYNYINKKNYNKIKVLYNAVDTNFFKTSEIQEKNEFKVLIPRNLNPARGVFLIPKVAYYLKQWGYNVKFGIVGTGPTKKYIEKMLKKYHLSKEVFLLGHIGDRETIKNLYLTYNLVIIPTVFSEGTSLSALEAMSIGRLVLMTNVGGLKEIGVDLFSKIVISKNSLNIAEKIRDIIDKNISSDYISKNGCKLVNEKHNLKNWQEEWFSILNGIFNK